jgi:hypothetical protein
MKTTLIKGSAQIVATGSSCVGCMAWETPYIIFEVNGETYKWQSDNIYRIAKEKDNLKECHLQKGMFFDVEFLVRENKVWRVRDIKYS